MSKFNKNLNLGVLHLLLITLMMFSRMNHAANDHPNYDLQLYLGTLRSFVVIGEPIKLTAILRHRLPNGALGPSIPGVPITVAGSKATLSAFGEAVTDSTGAVTFDVEFTSAGHGTVTAQATVGGVSLSAGLAYKVKEQLAIGLVEGGVRSDFSGLTSRIRAWDNVSNAPAILQQIRWGDGTGSFQFLATDVHGYADHTLPYTSPALATDFFVYKFSQFPLAADVEGPQFTLGAASTLVLQDDILDAVQGWPFHPTVSASTMSLDWTLTALDYPNAAENFQTGIYQSPLSIDGTAFVKRYSGPIEINVTGPYGLQTSALVNPAPRFKIGELGTQPKHTIHLSEL
jgi:hypothetical protein